MTLEVSKEGKIIKNLKIPPKIASKKNDAMSEAKIRNKERNAVQNKVNDQINKLNSISTMISAHTTSKEKGKSLFKTILIHIVS